MPEATSQHLLVLRVCVCVCAHARVQSYQSSLASLLLVQQSLQPVCCRLQSAVAVLLTDVQESLTLQRSMV